MIILEYCVSASNKKRICIHLSHCSSYFFVVVCLRCLLHHIMLLIAYTLRENREFVFIIILQFMMSASNRIRFVLKIAFVCFYITPSHYHHCANLSEDIEIIKCLSDYFVECVNKIGHIISVIHYTICGAVCFQFTHSLVTIRRIYILCLIIIKSEVWTITHCLGLGRETMVCAVCHFVFLWTLFTISADWVCPWYIDWYQAMCFSLCLYIPERIWITNDNRVRFVL